VYAASLPALAHHVGGNRALRCLHLTLVQAVERFRRPAYRPRIAA
jgi:hypothetical protein